MAPIRVGMVGLSKSAAVSWAARAHLPYLLSARGKAKYEITALCNSSLESAKKAVVDFGLPSSTKVYGNAAQLANDPDVDLVVCNVRVDRHYEIIRPSIEAGKSVFCEWPLASNLEQIKNAVELARQKGCKTIIGTQGRLAPIVLKVKEVLESGRIGKVLSSEVRAAGGTVDRSSMPITMEYFTDKSVGGNVYTIGTGHLLDSVLSTLSSVKTVKSTLQIQRPETRIRDPQSKEIVKTVHSDVPDLIISSIALQGSHSVSDNATLLMRLRRGQPFPGEIPLIWSINGEKGELRLTSPGGTALGVASDDQPAQLELHDHSSDQVKTISWNWASWQEELPAASRSIAAIYDNFADGRPYPTFEDALKNHLLLEAITTDALTTGTESQSL